MVGILYRRNIEPAMPMISPVLTRYFGQRAHDRRHASRQRRREAAPPPLKMPPPRRAIRSPPAHTPPPPPRSPRAFQPPADCRSARSSISSLPQASAAADTRSIRAWKLQHARFPGISCAASDVDTRTRRHAPPRLAAVMTRAGAEVRRAQTSR